jgi:glycosyltransferase involved in cell wall biosynthesis
MNAQGDRLKILFAIPSLAGGGAERVVTVLLRNIDRERFEPVLVLAAGSGPLRRHVPDDVEVVEIGAKRTRGSVAGLVKAVRKYRPHVVFSTLGHLNMLMRMAGPLMPRGTAFVARENNIPSRNLENTSRPGLWRFLYKKLYPGFDRVICQSSDMLEDMAENFKIPRHKCAVIANPVDVDRVRELAGAGEPDFSPQGLNLLACGRLTDQKGFDLLVRAMAELDDTVALTVLGDGPLRQGLELLAQEEGVSHKVRFAGFSDNPYPDMAACAAFILSSRYEGFPNVVLEALALGARVAAFDCPGDVGEIIEGLPGCALAERENPQDLARAIKEVLAAPGEPDTLSSSVRERYGARTITRRYEEVFEEAAKQT